MSSPASRQHTFFILNWGGPWREVENTYPVFRYAAQTSAGV